MTLRTPAIRRLATLAPLCAAAIAMPALQMSNVFPDDGLPPAGGRYIASAPVDFGVAQFDGVMFDSFSGGTEAPRRAGESVDFQFSASFRATSSVDGAIDAPAMVSMRVTNVGRDGKTKNYDMEIMQFDVQTPGVLVRENPAWPSFGAAAITRMPGGNFQVVGFLNVFLQVSYDGGATWRSAMGMFGPDAVSFSLVGPV